MISIFLPIRKGSRRIINKNLKKLPHFSYGLTEIKIKQLEKFKFISSKLKQKFEFVVSTDSKKILKILKKYSWIKLHRRHKKLSTDDSLQGLINHVPKICKGDLILWTHVTSPFFDQKDYFDFIKKFLLEYKKKKFKSAFSADKVQKFIYREDKKWISHNYDKKKWPRTQDLLNSYILNSAALIAKRSVYELNRDRLCKNPLPIISRSNSGFDIDDLEDFNYIKKNLKKYGTKFREFSI
tara:strand:- start:611 stop:1327 length:717 start_codon:yes stop_codon:yes gene_type:complete